MDDKGGRHGGNATARLWRGSCAALAFVLCASAQAGPAPGTLITNRASASAQVGAATQSAMSNSVAITVGAAPPPSSTPPPSAYSATLQPVLNFASRPGATVWLAHTLTNTGANPDSYTLSIAGVTTLSGYSFSSVQLFPDANGDGRPDGATPLSGAIALNPGQSYRFVAQAVVPADAPSLGVGHASIGAASAGGASVQPIVDTVAMANLAVGDCAGVEKSISAGAGPSPGGPLTVTLLYHTCTAAKAKILITDGLPAGMRYVPGSGRWSVTGDLALSDAVASDDRQGSGSTKIAYDYGVTTRGTVTATLLDVPASSIGSLKFQVTVDPDLAMGTVLRNTAYYTLYDASGNDQGQALTNTVEYVVSGKVDFDLVGQHLPSAEPGSAASFANVLTNHGSATDTFEIALGASTFPAGTTFALYQADGVTPLSDTDRDGTPDTGPVAPGASYTIVLKAQIPATAPPAAYQVTKTARAASAPASVASADDSVGTIALHCALDLERENQARVGLRRAHDLLALPHESRQLHGERAGRRGLPRRQRRLRRLDVVGLRRRRRRGQRRDAGGGGRARHPDPPRLDDDAAARRIEAPAGGRAFAGERDEIGQIPAGVGRRHAHPRELGQRHAGREGHHAPRRYGERGATDRRHPQLHGFELRDADHLGRGGRNALAARRCAVVQRLARCDRSAHDRHHRTERRARGSDRSRNRRGHRRLPRAGAAGPRTSGLRGRRQARGRRRHDVRLPGPRVHAVDRERRDADGAVERGVRQRDGRGGRGRERDPRERFGRELRRDARRGRGRREPCDDRCAGALFVPAGGTRQLLPCGAAAERLPVPVAGRRGRSCPRATTWP